MDTMSSRFTIRNVDLGPHFWSNFDSEYQIWVLDYVKCQNPVRWSQRKGKIFSLAPKKTKGKMFPFVVSLCWDVFPKHGGKKPDRSKSSENE